MLNLLKLVHTVQCILVYQSSWYTHPYICTSKFILKPFLTLFNHTKFRLHFRSIHPDNVLPSLTATKRRRLLSCNGLWEAIKGCMRILGEYCIEGLASQTGLLRIVWSCLVSQTRLLRIVWSCLVSQTWLLRIVWSCLDSQTRLQRIVWPHRQ